MSSVRDKESKSRKPHTIVRGLRPGSKLMNADRLTSVLLNGRHGYIRDPAVAAWRNGGQVQPE